MPPHQLFSVEMTLFLARLTSNHDPPDLSLPSS
jgi:hypothetical protein